MILSDYKDQIETALRNAKRYNKGLDIQITSLATALVARDKAMDQIETLTEVTVIELSRYGEKTVPHPAFKILRDANDSITRMMKILSLTAEDLTSDDDNDPLIELTKKLNETK